jgi:hypothetical protein
MTVKVTWDAGGDASLGIVDGIHVTVCSSEKAFPPGASARGNLWVNDTAHPFTLKVNASKRETAGYVVRGRLVSATTVVIAAFAEHGIKG